ncbi:hypothetical protein OC846_001388 [Tilletia horrida]|uniref:DUF7918 domain-containing protein n=1 Tax=Tilletia horrida TaxID=155126 RepID=A0AAN6GUA4_9BASI|nr:hypothetical protein OC845_004485 [Tilletia horrida]KAK0556169.1 hypothetical protein OC846_001388 [Tilletia horrida]KAK0569095.1 hypothetical protein OC861_001337 [Tilletia horrida]
MQLTEDMEILILDSRGNPLEEWRTERVAKYEWRAYICAEANKRFAIQITRHNPSHENLAADIWMNGNYRKKIHTIKFPKGAARSDVIRGVESNRMMHPFIFNTLNTTEEIFDACENNEILSSMGEIMISTCPYDIEERTGGYGGGPSRDFEPRMPYADVKVYEKSKKAMLQNVSAGFGEPLPLTRERNRKPPPFIYIRKEPVHKIRFLPRSEYALEQAGIIDAHTAAALVEARKGPASPYADDEGRQGTRGNDSRSRTPRQPSTMADGVGSSTFSSAAAASGGMPAQRSSMPENLGRERERAESPDFTIIEVKREEEREPSSSEMSGRGNSIEDPLEISDDSDQDILELSDDSDLEDSGAEFLDLL